MKPQPSSNPSDTARPAADLVALRERVDAATGPSEQLDAEIMAALAAPEGAWAECSPYNGKWVVYCGRDRNNEPRLWEKRGWHRPDGWPLSTSLDAALALVERVLPGRQVALAGPWSWTAHTPRAGEPIWCASVEEDFETSGIGYREVNDLDHKGATPALALLSALLAALAATSGSDGVGRLVDTNSSGDTDE